MSRSVWKGPFVDTTLIKKAEKVAVSGRKEVIKTCQEDQQFYLNLLA